MAVRSDTLETDLSEVMGRSYRCIDNCALCCLCQPELLPGEESKFRADPRLRDSVVETHISPEVRGAAIKLRGRHGACHFLSGRRCMIYQDRPHFCRAFPVNIFVGWRIQVNANLSCRGIGLDGESLEDLAKSVLRDYTRRELEQELESARVVFDEFGRNVRRAKVSQSTSSLREAGSVVIEDLADEVGLSRVLAYAEHGRTRQNTSARDIVRLARRSDAASDIEELAIMDGTELFDLEELSLLPIYIDRRLNWNLYKLQGDAIVGYRLSEDGSVEEVSRTDPASVHLMPMTASGSKIFQDYMRTVNARDCFLGHAAHLCDMEGYSYNLAQVYLGALANNALDLWWRASFLASRAESERLDSAEVREGIVFFDMDLLDLPTIGAFI
ncbi:MAG: YkgJ family cysteine cluster protein [Candidatus Thermoplasmatota archaeon]|nr:YkgJ family cysteine cluster protein [Candidatus Thermoplasmatota archaeon]